MFEACGFHRGGLKEKMDERISNLTFFSRKLTFGLTRSWKGHKNVLCKRNVKLGFYAYFTRFCLGKACLTFDLTHLC